MGVRRAIRRLRESHKPIIILLSVISFIFSQAEYQVATIPHSASELSLHNSLESINQKQNRLNTSLSFLQYPSQINLLVKNEQGYKNLLCRIFLSMGSTRCIL